MKKILTFILYYALAFLIINLVDLLIEYVDYLKPYTFLIVPLVILCIMYVIGLGLKIRSLNKTLDNEESNYDELEHMYLKSQGLVRERNKEIDQLKTELKKYKVVGKYAEGDKVIAKYGNQDKQTTVKEVIVSNHTIKYKLVGCGTKHYKGNELKKVEENK